MEKGSVQPSIRNPWVSIWIRPQATIRAIISKHPRTWVLPLAAVEGVYLWVSSMTDSPMLMERLHWFAVLVFALIAGPILGIAVNLYLYSALMKWTGRMLGGHATGEQIRTALAWSSVPYAVAAALFMSGLAVFGQDFLKNMMAAQAGKPASIGALAGLLVFLGLSVWALFLNIRTAGAVQHFGVLRSIVNLVLPVPALLLIALLIRFFWLQPFNVPASSMMPTLQIGDHFFVSKLSYGYSQYSSPFGIQFAGRIWASEPERGDIAVFRLPRDPSTIFVKRIVGLPGDEIQMKDGVLHINGQRVSLQRETDFVILDENGHENQTFRFKETLPNGVSYSILDLVQNGALDNTPAYRVPERHYFVLGDNRDNSTDSRVDPLSGGVGFVPFENLIGKAVFTFFSAEKVTGSESLAQAFDNIRWDRMFHAP